MSTTEEASPAKSEGASVLSARAQVYVNLSHEMVQKYQNDENKEGAYHIAAILLKQSTLCDLLRAKALMILSTKKDHPRRLNLAQEAYRLLDEDLRHNIIERGDSIDECFPKVLFAHAKVLLEEAREADAAMYPDLAPGEPIVLKYHIEEQYQLIEESDNDGDQSPAAGEEIEADLEENIEASQGEGVSAEKESGDDGQSTVNVSDVEMGEEQMGVSTESETEVAATLKDMQLDSSPGSISHP